jgi:hypothetical protein
MNGHDEEARGFGETQVVPASPALDELIATFFDPVKLHFRGPDGAGRTFELSGKSSFTLGRDASCDVVFSNPRVSRIHASIELVEGQHLLRDNRSSNGTFLNGRRASPTNAFALREGDVIEIGSERIRFARGDAPLTGDVPVSAETGPRAYDLSELRRDGRAALEGAADARIRETIRVAFAGDTEVRALERSLTLVLDRLDAHAAALFMVDAQDELRVVAALPANEPAQPLSGVARSALRDGKGHLAPGPRPHDRTGGAGECGASVPSCASVPLARAGKLRGALVAQRASGLQLARADLALLAVIGERIEATLEHMSSRGATDTRFDFAD